MGRVEFPRLGAVDIIRAFHFQQKQSSIAFLGVTLGVTPITEKSKRFSCNGFRRLFGARPEHQEGVLSSPKKARNPSKNKGSGLFHVQGSPL